MKTFQQFDEGARAALKLIQGASRLVRRGNTKSVERALRRARKPQGSLIQTRHELSRPGKANTRDRSQNVIHSAAKRAGMKGGAARNRKDFKTPQKETSTYPETLNVDYHPRHNAKIDTNVNTFASGRVAAASANYAAKKASFKDPQWRKSQSIKRGVPQTKNMTRNFKEFNRRVVTTGGKMKQPVHQVDFIPRTDADIPKGVLDKHAMKRARNFRRAQVNLPKTLKDVAGAKKGDIVIGQPAIMMTGEKSTGVAKRADMYQNRYGRRITGLDKTKRTRGMIGAQGGQLPPNKQIKTKN